MDPVSNALLARSGLWNASLAPYSYPRVASTLASSNALRRS